MDIATITIQCSLIATALVMTYLFYKTNQRASSTMDTALAIIAGIEHVDIAGATMQSLLRQRDKFLRGVFIYTVNIKEINSESLVLRVGDLMANNLYMHFTNGIINTLVLPGAQQPFTITKASSKNDRITFGLSNGLSNAATSFLTSKNAGRGDVGLQVIAAVNIQK